MGYFILSMIFMLSGCASVQISGYISRVDHPYERKLAGSFEKIVSSTVFILKHKGWVIDSEADPAIYERDDRYDNNGYQNLLIMTSIKKKYRILYSNYTHLNVFIHSIGNTCDIEIRYETQTPMVKKFVSGRNDRVVKNILDAIEQDVNR